MARNADTRMVTVKKRYRKLRLENQHMELPKWETLTIAQYNEVRALVLLESRSENTLCRKIIRMAKPEEAVEE